MTLDIKIKTIPHWTQRYDTLGDWIYEEDGSLYIRVSDLRDWRMESLIAIHELVEAILCRHAEISQQEVDLFDMRWEFDDEPGDSTAAPYHRQHIIASVVEHLVALYLGVDWKDYEEKCRKLASTSSRSKATVQDSECA